MRDSKNEYQEPLWLALMYAFGFVFAIVGAVDIGA